MTPARINSIAYTIMNQIKATTTFFIRGSWGARAYTATMFQDHAALAFKVSGLYHKGIVVVAYNEATDSYDIHLLNTRKTLKKTISDIYCDQLGEIIDREVERGTTDLKTYSNKALADSARKMNRLSIN